MHRKGNSWRLSSSDLSMRALHVKRTCNYSNNNSEVRPREGVNVFSWAAQGQNSPQSHVWAVPHVVTSSLACQVPCPSSWYTPCFESGFGGISPAESFPGFYPEQHWVWSERQWKLRLKTYPWLWWPGAWSPVLTSVCPCCWTDSCSQPCCWT